MPTSQATSYTTLQPHLIPLSMSLTQPRPIDFFFSKTPSDFSLRALVCAVSSLRILSLHFLLRSHFFSEILFPMLLLSSPFISFIALLIIQKYLILICKFVYYLSFLSRTQTQRRTLFCSPLYFY